MGIELQMNILSSFSDTGELLSINEISHRIKKAYPQVHKEVKKIIGDGILRAQNIGKSIACIPDFSNPRTVLLYALSEEKKSKLFSEKNKPVKAAREIIRKKIDYNFGCIFFYRNTLYMLRNEESLPVLEDYVMSIVKGELSKEMQHLNKEKEKSSHKHNSKNEIFSLKIMPQEELLALSKTKGFLTEKTVLLGYERFFSILGGFSE